MERTVIYYFSATGNSLYVARQLRDAMDSVVLRSIPEDLRNEDFTADAERVGFVFPMHYFGLPMVVEDFLKRVDLSKASYIFAVATCGVPFTGTPFTAMNDILSSQGRRIDAAWFVRLVSNYIMMRDIPSKWRIGIREWMARRMMKKIVAYVKVKSPHSVWEWLPDAMKKFRTEWLARRTKLDQDFACDEEKCVHCGLCEHVCPVDNIRRPEGAPVWQQHCTECLACLHICPQHAINKGPNTAKRHLYRHKSILPQDLLMPRQTEE
jgi:ferredoxin/flavodoxin